MSRFANILEWTTRKDIEAIAHEEGITARMVYYIIADKRKKTPFSIINKLYERAEQNKRMTERIEELNRIAV